MLLVTLIAVFMKVAFSEFVIQSGAPFSTIALHPAVQPRSPYPVIPLQNAILSAPVSAFIQTAVQDTHSIQDLMLLPQLTSANIRQKYADGALYLSTLSGSVDPSSFVAEVNKDTQNVLPFSNFTVEKYAGIYAIAKTLEYKGFLPDVNTAVKMAKDYVKTVLSHTNQLASAASWGKIYDATIRGLFEFLSKHIHVTVNDLALIRDIYFSQLQ